MRDAKLEIWNVFFRGHFTVVGYFLLQTGGKQEVAGHKTITTSTEDHIFPDSGCAISSSRQLFIYSVTLPACRDQTRNRLVSPGQSWDLFTVTPEPVPGVRGACPLNCLTVQNLAAHFAHHTFRNRFARRQSIICRKKYAPHNPPPPPQKISPN